MKKCQVESFKKYQRVSIHFTPEGEKKIVIRFGQIDRHEDGFCYGRLDNGGTFCCPEIYVFPEGDPSSEYQIEAFKEWVKSSSEYHVLLSNYGSNLFNRDMGEFCCLPIRLAYRLWEKLEG